MEQMMITLPTSPVYLDKDFNNNCDEILEWRNDSSLMKWTRQSDLLSEMLHNQWISKIQADICNLMYTIHSHELGRIGVCGLTNINWIARHAEFSLYIGTEFKGHKYGIEAMKILIEHGFNTLNLRKIWGEVFEKNAACLKMCDRLGFSEDDGHSDHYYKNGEYITTKIVELFKNDWRKNWTPDYGNTPNCS